MAIELVDLPIKNGDFKQPIIYWLVVWNMNFIFHNILGIILPIDELIFFKMVKTTNQWIIAEFMGLVADFGNITTLMGFIADWELNWWTWLGEFYGWG